MDVPMSDILQGVLDAAQLARTAASTASADVSNFVESCLADAKKFLRIGNQFRLSDRTRFLNPDYLSGLPEGAPFSSFFQTKEQKILNFDGATPISSTLIGDDWKKATYNDFDWDNTWLDSAASTTPEQRAALERVVEAYGRSLNPKTPAEATAKLHQVVIDRQTFSTNLLSGPDLACRAPPAPAPAPTKRDITLTGKRTLMHLVRKHKL